MTQIIARLRKKLGKTNSLGLTVSENTFDVLPIKSPKELDFDTSFLSRFEVKEIMEGKITLLHSSKAIDWKKDWEYSDKSALWNYNLHYFEYLLPLVNAFRESGNKQILMKTEEIILGWINANPVGQHPGWEPYPTSLRIVCWLSYYGYVWNELSEDFRKIFLSSLHEQYMFLSRNLEIDILGNHYFENLKTLLLAALFFKDEPVYEKVLGLFINECQEEILPDGMHFELSPMYHKVVFEGILRVAIALDSVEKTNKEIIGFLQPMLDVAFSFEDGIKRIPLFNDGGNNVAKSLQALVETARVYFDLTPSFKSQLKSSGFYIFLIVFDDHKWKLIVDAGQPGPLYIPGHSHCDAMSYELFRDGNPIISNCGTFAYQCDKRDFFRSTAAHNTVKICNKEQSQFWGNFRIAKRSNVVVKNVSSESITMTMTDAYGNTSTRTIRISSGHIEIEDNSNDLFMEAFIHTYTPEQVKCIGRTMIETQPYAFDYGKVSKIPCIRLSGKSFLKHSVNLY